MKKHLRKVYRGLSVEKKKSPKKEMQASTEKGSHATRAFKMDENEENQDSYE